jgi:hypothetical protein
VTARGPGRPGEGGGADRLVVQADRRLARRLESLVAHRMAFLAGLPGTGKSLLVHQLAHLASREGRRVHLLQWDVARPVFEASPAGQRYPMIDGVTHPVVRKAAGLWARHALVEWNERHAGAEHLLIGETPLVGNRFIELARRLDDPAEALLASPSSRFVIAVPSVEVRRHLETERERRAARPLHPREREDAPPHVLRALWRDLAAVAGRLGIPTAASGDDPGALAYDPAVYARVYEALLRHRHVEVITLHVILPTGALSVYDYAVAPAGLVPVQAEADAFIREVERHAPDPLSLEREVARWWEV